MDFRVTYDHSVDAMYIYLRAIGPGECRRQVEAVPQTIILGFDREDMLIGIEILNARRNIDPQICKDAEQI